MVKMSENLLFITVREYFVNNVTILFVLLLFKLLKLCFEISQLIQNLILALMINQYKLFAKENYMFCS